ncbi:PilZ domain-containing protein [Desulfonema ishimotonii]|uniref:PilZ domain-containing protein n=1 Tax=Desulfonema ishimotonii TaxID=45657 RepID=A0A401G0P4_9BACT|nr:PilZ domain-containing protein [Desulfonema ishimotonii]GBC62795.1 PilZ domain-containing protein [Desulfonema ishimotonii]
MTENKRRFTRVPFKVKTRLAFDNLHYTADALYNLSVGGCLFHLDINPALGTLCSVTIFLNTEGKSVRVSVDGEIVRAEAGMVAVKFTRIEPESLFHLQNIIRYNAPDCIAVEHEIETHPGLK